MENNNNKFVPRYPNMTKDEFSRIIKEVFEINTKRPAIYMSPAQYELFDKAIKEEVKHRYGEEL